MKSNIKIVLFTLVILFVFSSMFEAFSNGGKNVIEFNEENPNQIEKSGSWNLIGTTISIDNNWTAVKAAHEWCTGEGTESEPYIIENVTIDSQDSGSCIEIQNSNEYFIIQNCSLYNAGSAHDAGITLNNVTNGKIINTYCYRNYHGIYLTLSDSNTVSGNTASNNLDNGICLYESINNTVSGNAVSYNWGGIALDESENNTVSDNTASNNYIHGIYLYGSDNNTVSDNTANYNYYHGIYLYGSDNNTFSENTASNNSAGIYLYGSDNNTFSENTASNNNYYGVYLYGSENNTFSGNLMNFCGIGLEGSLEEMASHYIDDTNLVNNKPIYYYVNEVSLSSSDFTSAGQIILINCNNSIISGNNLSNCSVGMYLGYSNNNTLSGNTASNNYNYGIYLYGSDNNTFSGNTASNNYNYGIYLYGSDNNTFSDNTASYNYYGIILSVSDNNTIFLNFFTNHFNARDDGTINIWDNGFIGNYWNDYQGVDANNDGIGDTPYFIPGSAGSQDNFPIWTDGDDIAPVITIIFPLADSVFGLVAPNYNITIDELNLDTIWYTLDGGITNYTITGLTGTFNQTAWEALSEGSLIIRFYANDTVGNIGFKDVEVIIEIPEDQPIIPFGNYFLLFTIIAILSLTILEHQKKNYHLR